MKQFKSILYIFALTLIGCVAFASCGFDEDDEPAPDPGTQEPAIPDSVSRVILVYMVANNNLGGYFDLNDLNEMKQAARAGDFGDGRLLIFHHGVNTDESEIEQRLYEIRPDGSELTLAEYDNELSSVSMERMKQVLDDAERLAPTKSRGLMLWSHADGWINTGYENPEDASRASLRGFGIDGSGVSAKKMSISALGRVLDGRYFDFVYFDCCYMASVEVMYEMRESARYFVASAAELPADGARYHEALKYLFAPELDVVSAAKVSFEYYRENTQSGCTLSVVCSDALSNLADATAQIYSLHPMLPDINIIQQFQNFGSVSGKNYGYNYFDLDHYMQNLIADNSEMYAFWKSVLDDTVMYQGATARIQMNNRFQVNHHCGLTTYIALSPESASNQNYSQLKWYRDVVSKQFE